MMQKQVTTKNNEAGFMGLEGMGALLFYLVMLAGAALLIVQLFSGGKLSETEKALSSLRMGIQQLYTAQGNYGTTGYITETVADAGILPKGFEYDKTDKGIKTPWDTNITVSSIEGGKKFSIDVVVPHDDCVKLATYDMKAWLETKNDEFVITSVESARQQCTGEQTTLTFVAN